MPRYNLDELEDEVIALSRLERETAPLILRLDEQASQPIETKH